MTKIEPTPVTTRVITLQLSPHVDHITDDGHELTQLPYPFHVHENGDIDRQDFWRGNPLRVLGFQHDLAKQRVDLWWRDAWPNPEQAVGMYLVTQNDSGMAVHVAAIQSVRIHEIQATS